MPKGKTVSDTVCLALLIFAAVTQHGKNRQVPWSQLENSNATAVMTLFDSTSRNKNNLSRLYADIWRNGRRGFNSFPGFESVRSVLLDTAVFDEWLTGVCGNPLNKEDIWTTVKSHFLRLLRSRSAVVCSCLYIVSFLLLSRKPSCYVKLAAGD
jgi:hypothetical protein